MPPLSLNIFSWTPLFFGIGRKPMRRKMPHYPIRGQIRYCPRGQRLFARAATTSPIFTSSSRGAFQLSHPGADGKEQTLKILKNGHTLCENDIMDSRHTHRASAMPLEESLVLEFPAAWLKETA